jgi:hypothetical protein
MRKSASKVAIFVGFQRKTGLNEAIFDPSDKHPLVHIADLKSVIKMGCTIIGEIDGMGGVGVSEERVWAREQGAD